jgi:hypothetical protein
VRAVADWLEACHAGITAQPEQVAWLVTRSGECLTRA